MSDELKPGAFFDLYGVTADDGGNLDPREPTVVIDPSFVVGRMASERDEVRRLQTSGGGLTRYLASVERALTDAQAQRAAGGR